MTKHLALAAAIGLVLGVASDLTLAQSTSSTTSTATTPEQRATTPKATHSAATKATKRWDGINLKPVDERANAKPAAPDAVRNAPAPGDATTGTGCHHSKADDA
jgi:hypothetical protein